MKLRQRVQIDIAVRQSEVQAKCGGIDPQVAMGQLHALGSRSGAAGVVDGCRGVFIGFPWKWLCIEAHELGIGLGSDDELALALHRCHRLFELRVDEQHARP